MTSVYINQAQNKKATLLYLMGATWHNACMFDIKHDGTSFASLLNNQGIETYTFNIKGTGPGPKETFIGDGHSENINTALQLIEQYQIEYVLGYSYGAMLVSDMYDRLPSCVKGIILLDPYAILNQSNNVFIDNFDKKVVTRKQVDADLKELGSTMPAELKDAYLNALSDSETLITAAYPGKVLKGGFERFSAQSNIDKLSSKKFLAVFSKNANPKVSAKFPASKSKTYPGSSHWLLLEKERFDFANDVVNFVDNQVT